MNAQLFLIKIGIDDKCLGTQKHTENGEVIVGDNTLIYVSDLMNYWKNRNPFNWISVKDELPPYNEIVLFYTEDGNVFESFWYDDSWEDFQNTCAMKVTHWCKIVPPTKIEEK